MNQKVLNCYTLLLRKPPLYRFVRYKMELEPFTKDELSLLAGLLISGSQCGYQDYFRDIVNEVESENTIGNLQSDYIYYQIKFLLENGLDPNHYLYLEKELCLPLELAIQIDNPRECLRLAALLLEHGANPNAKIANDEEEETVFESIDFDILFYELLNGYYYRNFQLWLLMMSYGGTVNGEIPVTFSSEKGDVRMFRDYERFGYQMDDSEGQRLDIIDKQTGEIVAYVD